LCPDSEVINHIRYFQLPGWRNEEYNEGKKGQLYLMIGLVLSNLCAGAGKQKAGPGRCQEQGQEGAEGVHAAQAGQVLFLFYSV
jgi:hypothetical protein